ncbi:hypothetical protein R1sor_000577 [Riccia sorocarpa]|uniref:DUF506 family protein n=1 Tax=Riccia sorocarpa TaxID=122646 RepID=A0ABD3GWQ4_9MARC
MRFCTYRDHTKSSDGTFFPSLQSRAAVSRFRSSRNIMPGFYGLRPALGSASRASSKAAVTSNAAAVKTVAAGTEQKRLDDKTALPAARNFEQPPTTAFARRGLYERRGPQAIQYQQQQPQPEPFRLGDAAGAGKVAAKAARGNGVDILKRMSNTDYSSSGSAHEINSVCLAEMVEGFFEDEVEFGSCGRARCNCKTGTCGDQLSDDEDSSPMIGSGEQTEILRGLLSPVNDYEVNVQNAVTATVKALSDESEFVSGEKSSSRLVMSRLRAVGHNAAICKSKWEHTGGIPGGDYEYIDVVNEAFGAKPERLIVDLDFRTQFEIARPSQEYKALLQIVPTIFVGKADRLMQVLNVLFEATKKSMKKKNIPLAPWRKAEYIKSKWFSMYKRTTNASSSASSMSSRDGSDVGGLIFRGPGWDPKFATEMEANFNHRALAAERRKVLRDSNGINNQNPATGGPTVQQPFKKPEPVTLEPEGVVRGARFMLDVAKISKTEAMAIGERASQVKEWEPPTVDSSIRSGKAARRGTSMLAAILTEEGGIMRTRDEFREPCKPVFATGAVLI